MQAGAVNEQMTQWAQAWRAAPHGHKSTVMREAAAALHKSVPTLHRQFKRLIAIHAPRKRRSDAGKTALTRAETMTIAAALQEHPRANGKQTLAMHQALTNLRASRLIRAERIDPQTGEVLPLSVSTAWRVIKQEAMHPNQLKQPEPVMPLRSLHPNHVWQIDASRCVLYYLPRPDSPGESGLQVMEETTYYKNKPANVMKALRAALWRYVVTDHASGWVYVQYVLDGETAANLIDVFIGAMTQRAGQALHGVPQMVMLDPGSANTSAAFLNLCQALRVRVQINTPGHPRAKGQVEKAQDIVERAFESGLKTLPRDEVSTLEKINALAGQWMRTFNGTAVHRRHGLTRDAAWLKILPAQLVAMPDAALLRQLAASKPEARKVKPDMTVSVGGKHWHVEQIPGVLVGQTLSVCRNAFDAASVQAVGHDENGVQTFHILPECQYNAWGQRLDAPVIGESYKRHADTPAQVNAKAIERLAMGAASDGEAAQKRKERAAFLGGRYQPYAATKQALDTLATPLPKRGQAHGLDALQVPSVAEAPLTHYHAAKRLKDRIGEWGGAHYAHLVRLYPDGVPEADLDAAAAAIAGAMQPAAFPVATTPAPRLHAVG